MPKLSILIPVYNEAAYIQRCLENIYNENIGKWEKEIIVVNDGSTDETEQVLKEFKVINPRIHILTHNRNRGKGAAIKYAATKASGDVLIIQDADLEYDPHDYKILLDQYDDPEIKVVYGSRILGAKIYTNYNSNIFFYFGGIILTKYINLLFHTTLTDQTTCYKSWRSEFTPALLEASSCDDFSFEIEITAYFAKKYSIIEVPIHYYPRGINHGKKIRLKDFFLSLLTGLRCKFEKE